MLRRFCIFMSKSFQIWVHFSPLLSFKDFKNLTSLDIEIWDVGAKRQLNKVRKCKLKDILWKASWSIKWYCKTYLKPTNLPTCIADSKTQIVIQLKNLIVMKLKNSNCDKTQKLKLWWNLETQMWWNSKTQIVMKFKNSNCEVT